MVVGIDSIAILEEEVDHMIHIMVEEIEGIQEADTVLGVVTETIEIDDMKEADPETVAGTNIELY